MITENRAHRNYGNISVEQPPSTIQEFVLEYAKRNVPELYKLNTAVTTAVKTLEPFTTGSDTCGYESEVTKLYAELRETADRLEADINRCFYDAVSSYKENEPI